MEADLKYSYYWADSAGMRLLLIGLLALPLAAENYGGAIPIGMSVAKDVKGCGQVTTGSCDEAAVKSSSNVQPPRASAKTKRAAAARNHGNGTMVSRTFHKAMFWHHD